MSVDKIPAPLSVLSVIVCFNGLCYCVGECSGRTMASAALHVPQVFPVSIMTRGTLASIIQGLLVGDQEAGPFDQEGAFPQALCRGEGPQH